MILRHFSGALSAVLAVVLSGCTAAGGDESKGATTTIAIPRPSTRRSVVALLDLSLSFGNMADANRKLTEISAALGPGDEFVLH